MKRLLRGFKLYRKSSGYDWAYTNYRGWITYHELNFYLAYGFDPIMVKLKNILKWIRQKLCKHEYYQDIQIRILRCKRCGHETWLKGYEDLYKKISLG